VTAVADSRWPSGEEHPWTFDSLCTQLSGLIRDSATAPGHFDNQVALPSDVDPFQTAAALRDGVLTVRAPKAADDVVPGVEPVAVPVSGPL
jgi:HSP20 family protein